MALREELEGSGNWLFRWRSYLPLLLIVGFMVAMLGFGHLGHSDFWDTIWEVFCLATGFIGLGIRMLTIGQVPRGTSGRNTAEQVADTLNTDGVYSVSRNPLYLGNFFMWLGVALFSHLWWLVLVYVLVFWIYYERIVFAEEEYLRGKFGQEFLAWAAVTPIFFPRLDRFRRAELGFCWRNVLRREYNGFFALVLVMFAFETVGELVIYRRFSFDAWWLWLLGVSFGIWLTLRTLKKHTKVLEVAGR